jgi:adenine-specific DNA-methyltransferase
MFDVKRFGQVFTPPVVVEQMLALRKNRGRVLEPASGNGAFSNRLADCVAIELDATLAPATALVMDFFAYPTENRFETIIGNPPYVRFQDILPETKARLCMQFFDERTNLYLFFIEKCLRHLTAHGELIFITLATF